MKKYIPFLLLLLTQGCIFPEDDDFQPDPTLPPIEQLPQITSEGAHTFGCLINGEVWVSDNDHRFGSGSQLKVSFDFPEGVLGIIGSRKRGESRQSLYVQAVSVYELGLYSLFKRDRVFIDWDSGCQYDLDTLEESYIKVNHIDYERKTYSGEFAFTLYLENDGCPDDTLRITEGRFDVEY